MQAAVARPGMSARAMRASLLDRTFATPQMAVSLERRGCALGPATTSLATRPGVCPNSQMDGWYPCPATLRQLPTAAAAAVEEEVRYSCM